MKYVLQKDGDWIQPIRKGYKVACCDCGLVHKIDIRVRGSKIQYRATRDKRATGQFRRKLKRDSKSEDGK